MKKLVIILLFITSLSKAQEVKYAVYNTVSSGLIGGVGAGLNKHKGQSFFQAFKKGFVKGCVGGTLNYTSKYMLSWQDSYSDNLNWRVFWSSKIVNSVSNTIIYNAANNNDTWLGHYAINVGFLRFSVDHKVQIDAISALCMGYIFTTGARLDVERSLIVGNFVYENNLGIDTTVINTKKIRENLLTKNLTLEEKSKVLQIPDKTIELNSKHKGYMLGQNIVLNSSCYNNSVLKHEIIHTYQRLQYQSIVPIKKYENIGIFHLDVSVFDVLYFSQNKIIGYKQNYFENEANFYMD